MNRKIFYIFLVLAAWIVPAFAQDTLKISDISRVMSRLMHYHIEMKELNPALIRRSLRLYIEQFDPDKSYLLESEAAPYLKMTDEKALEILVRIQRKNYSDYMELNNLIERAIVRAQTLREIVAEEMLDQNFAASPPILLSLYPKTDSEVFERQKIRMTKFYLFHQARTLLDSAERKMSVFQLFEKKIRRSENNYLFLNRHGNNLAKSQIEHLFALRVLKSFAKSLDTHTAFFSPEEAYEMRHTLEKQFEGVGVVLSEGIDGVMIADLIEGSPAHQSGQIQVNDYLVEIDGKALSAASFEDVLELLKKRDQSEIILGFKRFGPSNQEHFYRVSLKKRPIAIKNDRIQTSYEVVDGGIIGKIALHSFYESGDGVSSEKDIKEAIRYFRSVGELKGLVLDLRENSGGFLGQAVRVAGLFVSNVVIVISKYGKGDIHYLRNISGKSYFSGPLVVLTSKMSASASEIVAQALQDYGVALVVGDETTFGKGSIQYQTITDHSADLFFKVTVGKYYTVSGKSAQIEGVKADIVVPTGYAPYNIGERYLEYPLVADSVDPAYEDTLRDLDEKTRLLFERRYTPYLQRAVTFWKNALPLLQEKSRTRLGNSPEFQRFFQKMERIRDRQTGQVNSVDEAINMSLDDIQMKEAVHIVEDMIELNEQTASPEAALLPTGSD